MTMNEDQLSASKQRQVLRTEEKIRNLAQLPNPFGFCHTKKLSSHSIRNVTCCNWQEFHRRHIDTHIKKNLQWERNKMYGGQARPSPIYIYIFPSQSASDIEQRVGEAYLWNWMDLFFFFQRV